MAYVTVKGGREAIEASIEKVRYEQFKGGVILKAEEVKSSMKSLVDQVMSEASLYDEDLAALSICQGEGSPEECVFLLRAYRSTLPRKHYSLEIKSEEMRIHRRISASFKDIPGGQLLGASRDYTHRLLDEEYFDKEAIRQVVEKWDELEMHEESELQFPKVLDYLRAQKMMVEYPVSEEEPDDVTKVSLTFPSSRSQRLQVLTRGQTGAVTALGYASLRGFGSVHPTVGELRVGRLPVSIANPMDEKDEDDGYSIGDIEVTEVESIIPTFIEREDKSREMRFEIGYGICFGQNESKAIAMSILDNCLEHPSEVPTHQEEFVLLHIDSVEATGFISHLKLPHYVTFQAELDGVRKESK